MQNTGKNRLGANQSLGEIAIPVAITPTGEISGSSIFRDLQQGRPIEADQIIGDLLARGAKAGIPTPLLAAAYANMSVYQDRPAQS
jgi:ketopantoate reductase